MSRPTPGGAIPPLVSPHPSGRRAQSAALTTLVATLASAGIRAENWTDSVTVHCRACGLGRVDYDSPEHVHHGTSQGDGTSTIGCSGNLIQVDEVVRAWAGTGQATVVAIEEVA